MRIRWSGDGKYFAGLSLFALLYNINLIYKLKFNDLKKKLLKTISIDCTNFQQSTLYPTFHSEERLVNLVRERGYFVSLSILIVWDEKTSEKNSCHRYFTARDCKRYGMSTCVGCVDEKNTKLYN